MADAEAKAKKVAAAKKKVIILRQWKISFLFYFAMSPFFYM